MAGNTIVITPQPLGRFDEATAGTVILPGEALEIASTGLVHRAIGAVGELVKQATIPIACEMAIFGKSVKDAYAIGDRVRFYYPLSGDDVQLLLATASDLVIGDDVVPAGGTDGEWNEAAGTEAAYHYKAKESTGGALSAAGLVTCRKN